jgi:L-asparaginase II
VGPIVVEVRRNGVVEARHRVHAVAVRAGAVVAEAGDAGLSCFMRSASKPIQALPLARARGDLDERELAIACASHRGTGEQVAAVRALLERAPAAETDLDLDPQEGRPPDALHHNCSGKHAGMLALCRAHGWELAGYVDPGHSVQLSCRDAHAEAAGVDVDELGTGVDGCRVVTFALPLERMAYAYSRLPELPSGQRVVDAMRAHPQLVGGPDGVDFELMRAASGWFAKGGAEGLLCAAVPGGTAVALKVEDGAYRPLGPALAAFLAPLGVSLPALETAPVRSGRGEIVGELAVATS